MEKKFFRFLLLSLVVFSSCKNSDFAMKRDYANDYSIKFKDVIIEHDLGIYGDARVVYITYKEAHELTMEQYEKVDDNLFYTSDSLTMKIYCNHKFYSLNEAFDNDILSSKDIDEIYLKDFEYKENLLVSYVEAEYNNPYVTIPGRTSSIIYHDRLHYGTYGDCVVSLYMKSSTVIEESVEKVGDYEFNYRTTDYITVWNNHRFYSLSEAYQLGYLSNENVASIKERHDESYNELMDIFCNI